MKDYEIRKVSASVFDKNLKTIKRNHMLLSGQLRGGIPIIGSDMVLVAPDLTKAESEEIGLEDDDDYDF